MSLKLRQANWHWHPKVRSGAQLTTAERVIDWLNSFLGSFTYLIGQTIAVTIWIIINIWAYTQHFDPYPFILLNLAFSTQAAYAAPIILAAGVRTDKKREEIAKQDHEMLSELRNEHKALREFLEAKLGPIA